MARHRPSRRASSKIRDAVSPPRSYFCESLEQRLLFIVLHEGDTFEFFADNMHFERVVVMGNPGSTTLELIGSHIDTMTGAFSLNRMQGQLNGADVNGGFPPNATNNQGGGGGTGGTMAPTFSDSIFAIYVSHSDFSSRVAIADIPDLTMPGPHPMLPYDGSITLRVTPTAISGTNPANFTTTGPGGGGGALLGARTINPMGAMNQDNIPITQASIGAGVGETFPQPVNNILQAGLVVAPGNNLGAFLFGGTIIGQVNIHGSIDQFYAGWILTGKAAGELDSGIITFPQNFNVDGNVKDIVTAGPLGFDGVFPRVNAPQYVSGLDIHVGGVLGQIHTPAAIVCAVDVTHSPSVPPPDGHLATEIELPGPANSDQWDQAQLGDQGGAGGAFLRNDTFETPQFLGPTDGGGNIEVSGSLEEFVNIANGADFIDWYAVPLMAGQSVIVQVTETLGVGNLDVGVFDPHQRLVASDYNLADPTQTQEEPFLFKPDRPGVYRFAVTSFNNPNFLSEPAVTMLGEVPYILVIDNVGDLAWSGMYAGGNILDNPAVGNNQGFFVSTAPVFGFRVENGDFGATYSEGDIISEYAEALVPGFGTGQGRSAFDVFSYAVDRGNLRAAEGADLGTVTATNGTTNGGQPDVNPRIAFGLGPDVFAPNGSVGYLHARAPGGILDWNQLAFSPLLTLSPEAASQIAVGGDYQFVDAAGTFFGDLVADGSIGTIRCSDMGTTLPSYLQVNAANNTSRPGTIDLIDVTNNMGLNGPGGPAIVTGPGGNVRYIHIGPFGSIFRDLAFGGSAPEETTYQPGETADITDDSGAVIHLTPTGGTAGVLPQLFVTTYPIRGSGGAATVLVRSTGSVDVTSTGPSGTAEIGTILVAGTGTAVTNNNTLQAGNQGQTTGGGGGGGVTTGTRRQRRRARRAASFPLPGQPGGAPIPGGSGGVTTGTGTPGGPPIKNNTNGRFRLPTVPTPPSLAANATPLNININGPDKVDVYEITSPPDPAVADGSLIKGIGLVTAITDTTPGEIVNIHLNSLGTLTTNGSVGVAAPHGTPAAVLGNVHNPLSEDGGNIGNPWDYPFLQPTNMIRVLGNIVSLTAARGIGNVYAGFIHHANGSDGVPFPGTPPVPTGINPIGPSVDGNIGSITGPILAPVVSAGSMGSVNSPGGFAGSGSGAVGGAGLYSVGVIGPVVSGGDDRGQIISTLGQLGVTVNGVLDQATVANFSRFDYAEARAPDLQTPNLGANPITFPTLELGGVTARDGMIGSFIAGDHIGPIISGDPGFGIFDTRIRVLGEGTVDTVSAAGYGIRASIVQGGASIGAIVARGNGTNVSTASFPASVRLSETGVQFDPQSGVAISLLDDINVYLGTTSTVRQIPGVTDTGIIEDSTFIGSRDLGSVSAWSIRGRNVNTSGFPDPNFKEVFSAQTSTFNVANRIGNLNVVGPVRGLAMTTGRTSKFHFGADVAGLNMTVAGPIGTLVFNGSLLSDSFINANGPGGRIANLTIHGSLEGGVRASQKINKIRIDGSLVGNVQGTSLGTLSLGGGIGNGALTINDSVGTIQTDGDFGAGPGSALTINGSLQNLKVGRNFNGTLTVGGNLRNMTVDGSVLTGSNATIGNTLTLLKVGGDVQAGAIIKAHIIRKTLVKGQTLGTIMTV